MIEKQTYKDKYGQDFQLKILAMIARDESFVRQYLPLLEPTHFQYAPMVTIATLVLDAYKTYGVLPSATTTAAKADEYVVQNRLDDSYRGMLKSLISQIYTIDLSDRSMIAAEVVEFGKTQAIKGSILEVLAILGAKGNITDVENILRKAISFGHDHDIDLGINVVPNMLDIPLIFQNDQTFSVAGKIPILSFPTLNDCMKGGAGRGQVFGVMGYPGVGKSTLLRTFARDAMTMQVPVMHYTICDLAATEVAMRYSALLADVTVDELLQNTPNYRARASSWQQFRQLLKVKEFRPTSVPVDAIRSHLTELKATEGWQPGVIIVDYPDKLAPSLPREDRWTNEAHNIDILIDIAKEFNCVVWWAWHPTKDASRETVNTREMSDDYLLTMSDGKGAFEKCHGVDGIISLNINRQERGRSGGRVWIDKLRRGKLLTYPIQCVTQFERGQIMEARM